MAYMSIVRRLLIEKFLSTYDDPPLWDAEYESIPGNFLKKKEYGQGLRVKKNVRETRE